jgi:hypothetical protein
MRTARFEMRVEEDFFTSIDEWRREQPDLPTRAEAVRRLVEQSLRPPRGLSFSTEIKGLLALHPALKDEFWLPSEKASKKRSSARHPRSAAMDIQTFARHLSIVLKSVPGDHAARIRAMLAPFLA